MFTIHAGFSFNGFGKKTGLISISPFFIFTLKQSKCYTNNLPTKLKANAESLLT